MKRFVIELDEDKYIKLKKYVEQSGCSDYFDNAIAKATPLEEEFEKIKAEMIKNFWNEELDETQEAFNQGISKSILVLDNHISELKGENNG